MKRFKLMDKADHQLFTEVKYEDAKIFFCPVAEVSVIIDRKEVFFYSDKADQTLAKEFPTQGEAEDMAIRLADRIQFEHPDRTKKGLEDFVKSLGFWEIDPMPGSPSSL